MLEGLRMDAKTLMDPWRTSHFTAEKFRSAFPGAGEYEEWEKITKRRSLRKQKEFGQQQATAMKDAGVTF